MNTVCLAGSLVLLSLAQAFARAGEEADSTLPPRVARCVQGVTLSEDQQAPFQALKREFEAKWADARKRVAAHELAKWRVDAIEEDWCQRIDSLLTTKQKQARVIWLLQSATQIEFVETPLKDVVDYLKDLHHGLPLRIDRTALRRAKKDPDTAITANLKGLTLDSALRLTLRQVGLMHVVQERTVLITTEEEGRQLLQHGAVDPATFPSPPREAALKKLANVLREPVDVDFTETPLKDVAEYLKDLCRVEIQIDLHALEAAAVEPDSQCTIKLKGVSLDTALKQILGKLGLKHVLQDEVILITANPPAQPRPAKPPADEPDSSRQPHPDEREAVDRLEELGARYTLNEQGRLVWLRLDAVEAGDEALALAGQFPELESLSSEFCEPYRSRITDRGLAHLRQAPRLTDLELHGEKITDNGVANLAGLARLEKLKLGETDITDAAVKQLDKLVALRELALDGTRVDGSGFAALTDMDNLRILCLNETRASDENLKYLACFPRLEKLSLANTRIDGSGLEAVASLRRLKELNLGHTLMTDAGLGQLAALKSLTGLNLSDTQITDAGLRQIAGLTDLHNLELRGTRITDAGLVHLRTLNKLTSLGLSGTGITDAGLPALRTIPNLEWVSAYKTHASEKALRLLYRDLEKRGDAKRKKVEAEQPPPKKADDSDNPFGP